MDIELLLPWVSVLVPVVLITAMGLWVLKLSNQVKLLNQQVADLVTASAEHTSATVAKVTDFGHQQAESQARSLVVTRHLQTLQSELESLESQVRELKLQDPSVRPYQRAAELVKQGATLSEVMEACDIPQAEAEMLMMVHQKSD
ncbi:DUF2802 domain-containing protein [Alteromonas sp. KUL49]|uniref:DUF2802 domain-containing protein n=1 Tax=Alteromonas sp. KUL49 TaxID=2480798 RepID=UPI00102EFE35|nr:DUF2802 domain-containing protein [Alteromonas sp. KUL49]TAP39736.1 DUF2802 domain-containing protein [Alteromonas sp. KUL49]GEA11728.1 hypothetical protein KUL49_21030 [Alteromonas sp. KUL49]